MRDDNHDAQIKLPKASSYYRESLAKAVKALRDFEALSDIECITEMEDSFRSAVESAKKSSLQSAKWLGRYRAMFFEAAVWNPPTSDHAGLAKFMRDQLHESMKWDCYDRDAPKYSDYIEPLQAWKLKRQAHLRANVAWAEKNLSEECDRTASRRKWIIDLANSIGLPPGGFIDEADAA
jgi:hypothetical protein